MITKAFCVEIAITGAKLAVKVWDFDNEEKPLERIQGEKMKMKVSK